MNTDLENFEQRKKEVDRIVKQLTIEEKIEINLPKGLVEMLDRRYPNNNSVPVLHLWSAINEVAIQQLIDEKNKNAVKA